MFGYHFLPWQDCLGVEGFLSHNCSGFLKQLTRVSIVSQWVKLLLRIPKCLTRIPDLVLSYSTLNPASCQCSLKATKDGSNTCVPVTRVGDLGGDSGFRFLPDSALSVAGLG